MPKLTQTILVVDASAEKRGRLAHDLAATGCRVLEAADGATGLTMVRNGGIRLVVSELFLQTGESECLFQAVRRNRVHGTRMLAHTVHGTSSDRDWARRWGARGFLVQPTAADRLRYVVDRLLAGPTRRATGIHATTQRDTLPAALTDIESGDLRGAAAIVVGRDWWKGLPVRTRNEYRARARRTGVSLRSDAMMSPHFVEVRGAPRPRRKDRAAVWSSPYRRPNDPTSAHSE